MLNIEPAVVVDGIMPAAIRPHPVGDIASVLVAVPQLLPAVTMIFPAVPVHGPIAALVLFWNWMVPIEDGDNVQVLVTFPVGAATE
jgi:hypothetical protein